MRILITGGCGFVGSNLAMLFKTRYPSYEIVCFDNLNRRGSELNLRRLLENGIQFVHGDIRHKDDLKRVGQVDLIIEAAAEPSVLAGAGGDIEYLIDTNLNGTINALYMAKLWNAGFVFLSTSRVYPYDQLEKVKYTIGDTRFEIAGNQTIAGITKDGLTEAFPLEGVRSLYGATKLSSEYLIQEFCKNFGLDAVINRCGVLTGPYQMGKIDQGVVVLWMARHFWKGSLGYIGFGGEGLQVRDMLHVRDLFELLDYQVKNLKTYKGEIFNVGGSIDISVSLKELTGWCEKITGNTIPINKVAENRPADIPIYLTDNSKITAATGWKPTIGTEQILSEIYQWIHANEKDLRPILSS
ncbi:NAD-dependent epimerase/dehydratase family protein [Parasediminibacterium sp. JCM 36343]|uniref:NAD-dependent epimerase/dehydratase family protein n=1 Tax=Parasediminibacterium sp. JCM 36343 TaxID=3374279 RepID=UPI00397B3445